jgi:hypothetical protein
MILVINTAYGRRDKIIAPSMIKLIWKYKNQGLTHKAISRLVLGEF